MGLENPMTALARQLQQRGHSVVLFGIADVESRVRAVDIIEEALNLRRPSSPASEQIPATVFVVH